MSILDKPLASPHAYVLFLAGQDLPVLAQTVRTLGVMREAQDTVNARQVAAVALGDPLFAIKLIVWLENHRSRSQNHDITTLDHAIMMMGLGPFFDAFADIATVEEHMASRPEDLLKALHVIGCTRKAAQLARDWAILRHDIDVDEIALATLARPACDILFWIYAPSLAREIHTRLEHEPGLRSAVAQRAVLGCTEHDIQLELAHEWHLPQLLVTLMNAANVDNPRVRNVSLAIDFARYLANEGWDSPGLPSVVESLGNLLPVGRNQLLDRLGAPPAFRVRMQSGPHS